MGGRASSSPPRVWSATTPTMLSGTSDDTSRIDFPIASSPGKYRCWKRAIHDDHRRPAAQVLWTEVPAAEQCDAERAEVARAHLPEERVGLGAGGAGALGADEAVRAGVAGAWHPVHPRGAGEAGKRLDRLLHLGLDGDHPVRCLGARLRDGQLEAEASSGR